MCYNFRGTGLTKVSESTGDVSDHSRS